MRASAPLAIDWSKQTIPGNDAKQGGTGMPVSITLSLQFRETEIMTKFNFQDEAGLITKQRQFEKDRSF